MSSSYSPPPPPQNANFNSPSITIFLTITLLIFFFIGFFSIYFCRCFLDTLTNSWHLRRTPSGNIINTNGSLPNEGLDPSLIPFFPSFSYSSTKNFQIEKKNVISHECSICLAEFEDDDSLRLLTICFHVFHEECIDLWLKSHKTCPVCRSDLDLPRETLEKAYNINHMHGDASNQKNEPILEHAISIVIRDQDDVDDDDNNEERKGGYVEESITFDQEILHNKNVKKIKRFSRSHSTGHSITTAKEDENKYNLKLLQHINVKIKIGHNATFSCIAFGELSSLRYGEVLGCSNSGINQV